MCGLIYYFSLVIARRLSLDHAGVGGTDAGTVLDECAIKEDLTNAYSTLDSLISAVGPVTTEQVCFALHLSFNTD